MYENIFNKKDSKVCVGEKIENFFVPDCGPTQTRQNTEDNVKIRDVAKEGYCDLAKITPKSCGIVLRTSSENLERKFRKQSFISALERVTFSEKTRENLEIFAKVGREKTRKIEDLGSCGILKTSLKGVGKTKR